MFFLLKHYKWVLSAILMVALLVTGVWVWIALSPTSRQPNVIVNIDKTVIVQKVEELKRLETVKQTLQRDVEIVLDLGDFKLLNVTLLENKRTQKLAITGAVIAGIDFGKLKSDQVTLSSDKKKVTITLPAPEIFDANILEDKTTILKDDYTLLFRLSNIDNTKRRELNEFLLKQIIKQSKVALVDAACKNDILNMAGTNAKTTVKELFKNVEFDEITINIPGADKCELKVE